MQTVSADTVAAVQAAFTLYWHDCWCPDFFLDASLHVDYCPTHGYPWRAETELEAPLADCGCQGCRDNLDTFHEEFVAGTTHRRKEGFIPPSGRVPTLAVRTSLAVSTATLAQSLSAR